MPENQDREQAKLEVIATVSKPRIFLSAGEASGDHYGAELIRELRARVPEATFAGLGGTAMERAGLKRVVRAEDVAVMGITEILRHIPTIYASYRRLVRSILRDRPGIAVLIDFPDVNFRLAKHLKSAGVPVVWLVSPQLWAWKRRRLRWVQERVTRMMVIFPFEEPFYQARGVTAEFIGHPLADSKPQAGSQAGSRSAFAETYGLDPSRQWIALLPGSRAKEVNANLYAMLQAAILLNQDTEYEYMLPVASTLSVEELQSRIEVWVGRRKHFGGAPLPKIALVRDAGAALSHARVSVVASGTATVQAAVVGNPFVVVYRVSPMTFWLAKRLVRYPAEIPAATDEAGNLPIAMVNLIAGERLIPELLQGRFTGETVAAALQPLLRDGPERTRQIEGLKRVQQSLLAPGGGSPVHRVAETVMTLLEDRDAPPLRAEGSPKRGSPRLS